MQRTLFATGSQAKPRKHANGQQRLEFGPFRQSSLPMAMGTDPGRRGEPDPAWLDSVLDAYRETGRKQAPSLTAIQAAWDNRLSVLATLASLTGNPFDECEFAPQTCREAAMADRIALAKLNHVAEVITWIGPLALPKPLDAKSRAIALVGKGTSLRNGARIMGVPVTTFRRLLGRVD